MLIAAMGLRGAKQKRNPSRLAPRRHRGHSADRQWSYIGGRIFVLSPEIGCEPGLPVGAGVLICSSCYSLQSESMALNRAAILGLIVVGVVILFPIVSVVLLITVRAARIWAILFALELAPMVFALSLVLAIPALRKRLKDLLEDAKALPTKHEKVKFHELPLNERIISTLVGFPIVFGIVPTVFLFGALSHLNARELQQKIAVPNAIWYGYNLLLAYLFASHHQYSVSLALSSFIALASFHSNVAGLGTHKGVLRAYAFADAQPPSVVLTLALAFAAAFASIHYNVYSMDHAAYSGLHGWQDSIYFSIVTMATVGYGDILPLSHAARWLCSIEIICGFVILVVGLNVTLSVWLQRGSSFKTQGSPPEPQQGVSVAPGEPVQPKPRTPCEFEGKINT